MSILPTVAPRDLLRVLQKAGFVAQRQRGSHIRLVHPDGRIVSMPMHAGQDIGRGLLRKILRDADLSVEEFLELLR